METAMSNFRRLAKLFSKDTKIECLSWGDCSCDRCCNPERFLEKWFKEHFSDSSKTVSVEVIDSVKAQKALECLKELRTKLKELDGYAQDCGIVMTDTIWDILKVYGFKDESDCW
jgi:hypothetical protein